MKKFQDDINLIKAVEYLYNCQIFIHHHHYLPLLLDRRLLRRLWVLRATFLYNLLEM